MAEALKKEAPAPAPAAAAPARDRWTQWVALTTTVLAVCAAISALKGGSYSTRVQLATTEESNRWSHYQSKSIKDHGRAVEKDLLEVLRLQARDPEAARAVDARIAAAKDEIARYKKEEAEIKAEAERVKAEETGYKRHGAQFGLAVMLLQIAIMLNSIGALMKKPLMWGVGLLFGSAGLAYMLNGFFLWF
ncbi:DUF4337 domain-containing protein [Anaeromyxobacter paludicola]|uniref:DUF4337 domain-containing protein n=1 Tax=Anaeromyxobacter paludicola TaxID=2918171 RepID=A0ABM7X928_9BACT|nr:DUF4337 domain-containing protein [Anaeromyxobacter paludicola]BDG08349.1 hypothetical protein AMPC_14620 [Anaeromyxobacter paludicola]